MTDRMEAPWAWMDRVPAHLARYQDMGVWGLTTIADDAEALAAQSPDFPALVEGEAVMTRAELLADATALSAALQARGLRPGDVLSFQVPNWREAAVINLAAAQSGLVINPIVPIYRDHEVGQMLADCRARAFLVCSRFRSFDYLAMAGRLKATLPHLDLVISVRGEGKDDYAALVAEGRGLAFARPQVDPLSVKMLLYTSGTTGRPKGVLHSHASLARIVRQSSAHWGLKAGEATIMPSPVTHVSGYANGLEAPLLCGTSTILMESWNATDALALIKRHRAVGTVAATPFLVELAEAARAAGATLPSFRFFACGGAAVPDELIPSARQAFAACQPFRVFGASEVPLVTFGWPGDAERAAVTDGEVVDYDVRIVGPDGEPLGAGEEGEILARGPAMMLGYADRAQTAEAITEDGFFRTGDLGILDGAGAITITGRRKDLIIRGGENLSAREIEEVLHAHPLVAEAAVVSMPHERLGEGVCAYVVTRAGAAPTAEALMDHVRASGLARQKTPERFVFVDDLPRTASGKIRKDQLRADIRARMAGEQAGGRGSAG